MSRAIGSVSAAVLVLVACRDNESAAPAELPARDAGAMRDGEPAEAHDVEVLSATGLVPAPERLTIPTAPWPEGIGPQCPDGYREISIGASKCAVCRTGVVHCWGQANTQTFRAQASRTFRDDVVALTDLPPAKSMRSTEQGGCILGTDGIVRCWGTQVANSLRRSRTDRLELVTIATPSPAVQLVAGYDHVCARGHDGEVTCWGGWNDYGQLGPWNSALELEGLPRVIAGLRATTIASSSSSVCAIATDGQVWCWGAPPAVGDRHESKHAATAIPGMTHARALTVTAYESCALRDDGSIWCWGIPCAKQGERNSNALAFQRRVMRARPRKVAIAPWATQLSLAGDGPIAIDDDGHAFTFDRAGARVPVPGLAPVNSVTTAGCAACAILRTGELRCWGRGGLVLTVPGAANAPPP